MQTIGQLMYVDVSTQALQAFGAVDGALIPLLLISVVVVVVLAVWLRMVTKKKTSRVDAMNNLNLQG